MSLSCIYCGASLEIPSKEHVLLNALGGRKTTRTICCRTCNNTFGSAIDRELALQLQFMNNQLGAKTGDGKQTSTIRNVKLEEGLTIHLAPELRPELAKGEIQEEKNEYGELIGSKIIAKSMEDAKHLIEAAQKKYNLTDEQVQSFTVEERYEYVQIPEDFHFSIGGKDHFRALAKMLLNLLCSKTDPNRLRTEAFREIREMISGTDHELNSNWVRHCYNLEFPNTESIGEFQHRLFVFTTQATKLAYGLIELFGCLKFSCILSEHWEGPTLGFMYSVDPLTGKSLDLEIEQPQNITLAKLQEEEDFLNPIQAAIENLYSRSNQIRILNAQKEIVQRIVKKHIPDDNPELIAEKDKLIRQEINGEMAKLKEYLNKYLKS